MVNLNKKVTIEELKTRFPRRLTIQSYGECIVIPGDTVNPDDAFDPDWEAYLAEEGYECLDRLMDKKPVTLVPLKKVSGESEKSVLGPAESSKMRKKDERIPTSGPPPQPRREQKINRDWAPEEDKVLVEKWKEGKLTIREIREQCFPTRSKESVGMHVWDLQQRGIIQKKQVKGGRPKGTKKPEAKQKELKKSTDHSDESKVPSIGTEDLLKEILDCLRGFEPVTFSFEHHCRKCGTSGFAGDEPEVWRVCPRCGEPLIVWNVQSLEARANRGVCGKKTVSMRKTIPGLVECASQTVRA